MATTAVATASTKCTTSSSGSWELLLRPLSSVKWRTTERQARWGNVIKFLISDVSSVQFSENPVIITSSMMNWLVFFFWWNCCSRAVRCQATFNKNSCQERTCQILLHVLQVASLWSSNLQYNRDSNCQCVYYCVAGTAAANNWKKVNHSIVHTSSSSPKWACYNSDCLISSVIRRRCLLIKPAWRCCTYFWA